MVVEDIGAADRGIALRSGRGSAGVRKSANVSILGPRGWAAAPGFPPVAPGSPQPAPTTQKPHQMAPKSLLGTPLFQLRRFGTKSGEPREEREESERVSNGNRRSLARCREPSSPVTTAARDSKAARSSEEPHKAVKGCERNDNAPLTSCTLTEILIAPSSTAQSLLHGLAYRLLTRLW